MRKLTKKNLNELAEMMPRISEIEKRSIVGGGGDGTESSPFTMTEYDDFLDNGFFPGGWVVIRSGEAASYIVPSSSGEYVDDKGYVGAETVVTGIIPKEGAFGSYYIGPTSDGVLKARPKPAHAADYIAQQHDLDYIELHLDGVSGALNSKSDEANARLVVRCDQLIEEYESGGREYCGYEITQEAYYAAKFMRATFNFI